MKFARVLNNQRKSMSRLFTFFGILLLAACGGAASEQSRELKKRAQQYATIYLETLEVHALALEDMERWDTRVVELRMLGGEAKAQRYANALMEYSQRIKQAHSEAQSLIKARKDGDDYVGTAENLAADLVRMQGLKSTIESTRSTGNNTYEASLKDFPNQE
jgi:outer membrane PBP1 activator LpoA protein